EPLERIFRDTAEAHQTKLVNVAQPVRVALTGGAVSPSLFEIIPLMAIDTVVERLEKALAYAEESEP
ncbi:MAG: glutamate--tRNA ligase, partial [Armatimonadetes bacterium]|nr:glutamate--tRNA ligase [Armatimonadota bacterium]NIO98954.1 glutamate--tRNA ligase [Armatimonadota bacterium]